jgi:hypothetical protein
MIEGASGTSAARAEDRERRDGERDPERRHGDAMNPGATPNRDDVRHRAGVDVAGELAGRGFGRVEVAAVGQRQHELRRGSPSKEHVLVRVEGESPELVGRLPLEERGRRRLGESHPRLARDEHEEEQPDEPDHRRAKVRTTAPSRSMDRASVVSQRIAGLAKREGLRYGSTT